MLVEVMMFILNGLGLVAAAKQFLSRGHNLGIWGSA